MPRYSILERIHHVARVRRFARSALPNEVTNGPHDAVASAPARRFTKVPACRKCCGCRGKAVFASSRRSPLSRARRSGRALTWAARSRPLSSTWPPGVFEARSARADRYCRAARCPGFEAVAVWANTWEDLDTIPRQGPLRDHDSSGVLCWPVLEGTSRFGQGADAVQAWSQ